MVILFVGQYGKTVLAEHNLRDLPEMIRWFTCESYAAGTCDTRWSEQYGGDDSRDEGQMDQTFATHIPPLC